MISSLIAVVDIYCKTNCFIVSLIMQISWLLILRIPILEKTLLVSSIQG